MTPVKVHIQNFQSIKDLSFEIQGFTCVTGRTNIGKSSIIRALSGAIQNIPVGNLVRRGEKYTTVQIKSDTWGFKWEKGERVNRYWLDGQDKPLDKVGSGQFEEIANLGFRSVKVGSDHINPWCAQQFRPVFLMDQTGSAITDFISEVSHLKVLQNGIVITSRNKRRLQDEVKLREERLDSFREKEVKYLKLDSLLKLEPDLDAQMISIRKYEKEIIKLEEWITAIADLNHLIDAFYNHKFINIPQSYDQEELNKIQKMHLIWVTLETSAQSIICLRDVKNVEIPSVDCSTEINKILKLNRIAKTLTQLQTAINALSTEIPVPAPGEPLLKLSKTKAILTQMERINAEKKALEAKVEVIDNDLIAVKEELARIPTCPACGNPVAESCC